MVRVGVSVRVRVRVGIRVVQQTNALDKISRNLRASYIFYNSRHTTHIYLNAFVLSCCAVLCAVCCVVCCVLFCLLSCCAVLCAVCCGLSRLCTHLVLSMSVSLS